MPGLCCSADHRSSSLDHLGLVGLVGLPSLSGLVGLPPVAFESLIVVYRRFRHALGDHVAVHGDLADREASIRRAVVISHGSPPKTVKRLLV